MNPTRFALKRPITIIMLFVSLASVGAIASRMLPLEFLPEIDLPGAFIQVPYQGSSPEEVERVITRPLEESLATMSGIQRMSSTSSRDQATIRVFFGWQADADVKGMEVMDKIDSVRHQLPDDVRRVFVFRGSTSDQPIMVLRLSSQRDLSGSWDLINRNIKRRLERLDGVSQIRVNGVEKRELRVQLQSDRVAAYGISPLELTQRLEQANFSVTAGEITDNGRRLRVNPEGEFRSIEEIRDFVIRDNIRLRDIARVEVRNPDLEFKRHLDRKFAVALDVMKETGANMVDVADRVRDELDEVRELPEMEGISIFYMDDQAEGVQQSLSDLLNAGLLGALFSLIVLYLFLRQIATTLTVTLAVPISILIALGAMFFLDISLNILSMMGLMLAVGMLVDNAVVVTENVFRHKLKDPDHPVEATERGTREVITAVVAGTLTSIIVFVPIAFGSQSDIEVFLTHVAITIIVTLLASLALSLTLIPMVAARIRPPEPRTGQWIERLKDRYEQLLEWTMRRRWTTTLGGWLALGLIVLPFVLGIRMEMFPQDDSRRLFMPYHVEGTYSLDRVEEAVDRVEAYLYENREKFEIRSVYSFFERGRAQSTILLREEDAQRPVDEIMADIREGIPEIAIGRPSFDRQRTGGGEGLSIQLHGSSSERLADLSTDVTRILSHVEGLVDVRSEVAAGNREAIISVDRERAIRHGLETRAIADAVSIALRGRQLREFRSENGEIDMRVAYAEHDRYSPSDLEALPLTTPDGRQVRLDSVANIRIVQGPAQIERRERQTTIGITANLAGETTMNDVRPKIRELMDSMELPGGYGWSFGQGFQREQDAAATFAMNIGLALILIFIVMAALFEDVVQPVTIMFSILYAIQGAFWFILLTGSTFSMMAWIGVLILMGIVVNNGIVMVDHINHLRWQGMTRHEAIVSGARDRLRPILMTVLTTILGLTPLAFGETQLGGGGPAYSPMARAIMGGLAFSTLATLILLPTGYVLAEDFSRYLGRLFHRAAGRRPRAEAV